MQKRQWDAKTKAMVVLEGLKGKPIAEICTEHQIGQSQSYQWRDQLLAHAAQAFEVHQHTRQEARLGLENARLKRLVGALLLELKKSDERLAEGGVGRFGSCRGMSMCSREFRPSKLSSRSGATGESGRTATAWRISRSTSSGFCA